MADRIPLAEQLDEARAEYTRRCQAYPLLVAKGEMRREAMEFKIARMAAVHNTLAWLAKNSDHISEWVQFAIKFGGKTAEAEIAQDAPPDVLPPELTWEEPDGEAQEEAYPVDGEVGIGASGSAAAGSEVAGAV